MQHQQQQEGTGPLSEDRHTVVSEFFNLACHCSRLMHALCNPRERPNIRKNVYFNQGYLSFPWIATMQVLDCFVPNSLIRKCVIYSRT